MSKYISVTETAKLIRQALKDNFKGIKFSVRSRSYAGGASIDISWTDGPCDPAVERVVKKFQGASFDGMTDSTTYHTSNLNGEAVHFGADYVMTSRKMSREFIEAIAAQFCKHFGLPLDTIKAVGNAPYIYADTNALDRSQAHWFNDILRNTDAKDMHRAYQAEDERETRQRDEWEAEAKAQAEQEAKARAEAKAKTEREAKEREQAEFAQWQREQLYNEAWQKQQFAKWKEEQERLAREEAERKEKERKQERSRQEEFFRTFFGGQSGTPQKDPLVEAFKLLELSQRATVQEVKRKFKAMAKQGGYRHPDVGGSHDKFVKLNSAYELALKHAEMIEAN